MIYDFDDGDFIIDFGDYGFDSDGNMMMRVSDNMAWDTATGDFHFVLGWDEEDEEEDNLF